nr:zinc-binding dehydrogenase [Paraburkholderia caribensis]
MTGAGGGVGGFAVQMCRQAGARVLATASRSVDRVRSLGAEEVIDYRRGDVLAEAMRLTQGRGVDAVTDLSGVG